MLCPFFFQIIYITILFRRSTQISDYSESNISFISKKRNGGVYAEACEARAKEGACRLPIEGVNNTLMYLSERGPRYNFTLFRIPSHRRRRHFWSTPFSLINCSKKRHSKRPPPMESRERNYVFESSLGFLPNDNPLDWLIGMSVFVYGIEFQYILVHSSTF